MLVRMTLAFLLAAGCAACSQGRVVDGALDGGDAGAADASSPNMIPGQCVLSNAVWYCGQGYGDFPQCPATSGPCSDLDAAVCFHCPSAGETCACQAGVSSFDDSSAGQPTWQCTPSGTGCRQ